MISSAYVLNNCQLGYEDQTVNEHNKLTGVDDATRLDGAYDIIAKVNAESKDKLEQIIRLRITKIDRIQSILTLIVNEEEKGQGKEEQLTSKLISSCILRRGRL